MKSVQIARTLIAALLLIACAPGTSLAAKQFRCNGRIQYRPCNMDLFNGGHGLGGPSSQTSSETPRYQGRIGEDLNGPFYAKVLTQKFSVAGKREGLWRGRIEGNGNVHLKLVFSRNGTVEFERYMGHTLLKNKSTWFAFKSTTPSGRGWTWQVVAYNS